MQHTTIISNYPDLITFDDIKPPQESNYRDLYLTSPDISDEDEAEMPLLEDYPEPPSEPYPFSEKAKAEKIEESSCFTTIIIGLIGVGLTIIYSLSLILPCMNFY